MVAGADTAGEGCALAVDDEGVVAAVGDGLFAAAMATDAAAVATEAAATTFTCVTGPLSPALPMRTLTFTLLGAVCAAPAVASGAGAGVAAEGAAISAAVSAESAVVSGVGLAVPGASGAAGTGDDAGAPPSASP